VSETPSRISLVSVWDSEKNKPNIIPISWKMRTSFSPLIYAISVGKMRYSHKLISREREFVIAFPSTNLFSKVLSCGMTTGEKASKVDTFNIKTKKAKYVKAPLITGCLVNYECKVIDEMNTGDHTIYSGEVKACYTEEHNHMLLSAGTEEGYRVLHTGIGHRFGYCKGDHKWSKTN